MNGTPKIISVYSHYDLGNTLEAVVRFEPSTGAVSFEPHGRAASIVEKWFDEGVPNTEQGRYVPAAEPELFMRSIALLHSTYFSYVVDEAISTEPIHGLDH